MTWHYLGVIGHDAETRNLGVLLHDAEKRSIFENCFARGLIAKKFRKRAKLQKFHLFRLVPFLTLFRLRLVREII
jgi:hypothetical protein